MSPASRNGPNSSYRCRSEPQIAVDVIFTIASVGCSMIGSGTSSTVTFRLPCQVSAFIATPSIVVRKGQSQVGVYSSKGH